MTTPNEVTGYKAALEGREADIQALAVALAPLVNKLHDEQKAQGHASRETEKALSAKQSDMAAAQAELAQLRAELVGLSGGAADIADLKRSNAEIIAKMKAGARSGLTPQSKASEGRDWAKIVQANPGIKEILRGNTKSTGNITLPWSPPRYRKDVDAVDLAGRTRASYARVAHPSVQRDQRHVQDRSPESRLHRQHRNERRTLQRLNDERH
jgi:hypothetical protein